MSDKPPSTEPDPTTASTPVSPTTFSWGTPLTSMVAQATFVIALGVVGWLAWDKVDGAMPVLLTMAGVAATNATTVINYYVGSSTGSSKKTDLMAASLRR